MTVVFACVVAYALSCTFEVGLVPTGSMESTVLVGDHVLLAKLAYAPNLPLLKVRLPRWKKAKRGDLVSFEHPRSGMTYLKRVVAVGGDTVEIREHKLMVNGSEVTESYVSSSRLWRTMPVRRIAPGELFVLGDNRDNSEDSRYWGTVPESAVLGEPVMVLWSFRAPTSEWLDKAGHVRPAAYVDVTTHLFTRTRWSRVATRL
jgi:signal peptidase I